MVGIAQLVRAPDCDSGGRRFKSGYSPFICEKADFLSQPFRICLSSGLFRVLTVRWQSAIEMPPHQIITVNENDLV